VLSLALLLSTMANVHAETRAGTLITNVAATKVRGTEGDWIVSSNPATFLVVERLDVSLARIDDAAVTVTPEGVAIPFVLSNGGNGTEAFDITATLSDPTARIRLIAVDRDGDGRFDPAVDTALNPARTPRLEPGESLRLIAILDPATPDVTVAALELAARATTGSGPEGTVFTGRGDAGSDAVTGQTGAIARLVVPIGPGRSPVPVLAKSQTIRAPDGSANPVAGAIVTYRLDARFAAATAAVRIEDPIPAGTAYVPGSLMLDGARLSDVTGDDAGNADAAGIAVTLGDIPAAATRIVQFQVSIQ